MNCSQQLNSLFLIRIIKMQLWGVCLLLVAAASVGILEVDANGHSMFGRYIVSPPGSDWNDATIISKPPGNPCVCWSTHAPHTECPEDCSGPCCKCNIDQHDRKCCRRADLCARRPVQPPPPPEPTGRVAPHSPCICRKNGRDQRCEGLDCRYPCCECNDNKWLCCGKEICEDKGKKPFYEDCGCTKQ